MPLYEYTCTACGHNDTLLGKTDSPRKRKCPECGKARAFQRQVSAPAFHLKGDGWYVTDFRDKGGKPGTGDSDAKETKESKEDTASTATPAKPDSEATTAKKDGDAKGKDTKKPAGKEDRPAAKAT